MTVTVDSFLTGLKSRITFPANQQLLSDSDILTMADKVTREKMVPLLLSTNQNYFVTTALTLLVPGQESYPIHYRAIGRGLRDLKLVNTSSTQNTFNLALIALEDEHLFVNQAIPTGFYFSGDSIVMRPVPISSQYYLKQFFNLQPNALVPVASAAQVTSISSNVVTCSSVPTTFTAGANLDFIQGISGCSTLAFDVPSTNVSGNQITFASASVIPTALASGDFVTLARQTPVIQLPDEACPLFETLTGIRILNAQGDFDGASVLRGEASDQERDLLKIVEPRIEGEQTKIVNRNGLLRARGFNYFRVRGGYYF